MIESSSFSSSQWGHHNVDEATWEREDEMGVKYPTSFHKVRLNFEDEIPL